MSFFNVDVNTNNIPPTILNPKPFGFPSGGTGGGGSPSDWTNLLTLMGQILAHLSTIDNQVQQMEAQVNHIDSMITAGGGAAVHVTNFP